MKAASSIYASISGTGSCVPGDPVSNHELVKRLADLGVETSDEWIVSRTGIQSRHFANAETKTSDLALNAAQKAIASANIDPQLIDLIIVATSTPDYIFPSTACLLQNKLGIHNQATAFDVQAVCSGFVYALSVADAFIKSRKCRHALIVGAEIFSNLLDFKDRTTCVLFGDGAGAVVLSASEKPGILETVTHADGAYYDILYTQCAVRGGQIVGHPFIQMQGQAVFKVAVNALEKVAIEVLEKANVAVEEIDWLVPHQANIRIMSGTCRKLGLSEDKMVVTLHQHGNTSAASVPLALDAAIQDGRIKKGQKILLEAAGAGFTWGAALIQYD